MPNPTHLAPLITIEPDSCHCRKSSFKYKVVCKHEKFPRVVLLIRKVLQWENRKNLQPSLKLIRLNRANLHPSKNEQHQLNKSSGKLSTPANETVSTLSYTYVASADFLRTNMASFESFNGKSVLVTGAGRGKSCNYTLLRNFH